MAKKKFISQMNTGGSFVATLLFLYFLVCCVVLPFISALGGIGGIIADLVDLLPFGHLHCWVAVQLINAMFGQVVNYYAIEGIFTAAYVVQELSESIFTVIIYEAGSLFLSIIMGLDRNKTWINRKRLAVNVAMAVISACLAPALISWIFSNLPVLSTGWQIAISFLVSAILVGGGVAFFVFLNCLPIGIAIAYMALRFFLVGFLRIATSYICLFLLFNALQVGAFSAMFAAASGFLVLAIIIAAIELMINSAFK